jgi:hypothetical protein
MLVIMVRDVCVVNCAIGWLSGGILGALGAWKEMEPRTLPSQVPFFPFFCIFGLWVFSFSLNFLVCSSLFIFKFDLPT